MLRKKQTKIQEIDVEKEIIAKSHQLLHKIFKEKHKTAKTKSDEIEKATKVQLDNILVAYEKEHKVTLSKLIKDGVKRFHKMFGVTQRIALVGPICSGKSTILKLAGYALHKLQNRVMNYSVISPRTFTYGELYGSTDNVQAYSSDIESRDSIYSIILEKYREMDEKEESNIVKSIVIDSVIEEVDSECTIQQSMKLQKNQEMDHEMNKSYIKFPNGITLNFPNDLYFFYETDTLQNASPRFIAAVGVIMTHDKFITWREIIRNNINMLFESNTSFFKMFEITENSLLHDMDKVVVTIVNKFEAQYNELPLMWDKKMQTLNFFKVFKAYISELKSHILRKLKKNPDFAKETIDFYKKNIRQTINSFILISLVWSFSGILDVKNRRKFENVAASVDNGYKLNLVTTNKSENLSFFDLTFDFERMHWITVTDLDEYGTPVQIDRDNLLVMTDDYLKYSNYINFLLKNSGNNDFGFVIAGDTPTFKSSILKAISYKYGSNKLWLPMSCYLTLPNLKSEISNFAGGVRKKHDDHVIFIDDLHLQSNLNIDVLEYLRMWIKNRGHYNVQSKSFDSLSNQKAIMTFDLKYGIQSLKNVKNIDISQNRYTYYCHSLYIPPVHRSKMRRIFAGIISYRLDALYDHPLTHLQAPLLQCLMSLDEYFRKHISALKYSQFTNPNNLGQKVRILKTTLTRALDMEEGIETEKDLAQIVFSLTKQFMLLRVLDPKIKSDLEKEVRHIVSQEFGLNDDSELDQRDKQNLNKVVKQVQDKEVNWDIVSMETLDEARRLLEQIECGIRNHLVVTSEVIPLEKVVQTTCEIGGYSYYPLFNSKLVSRYFDAYEFKTAIQSSIKTHKKGTTRKTVLYISDAHHSDIVYADFLNVVISYSEEKCIFKEKKFIEKLCKLMKYSSSENKENTRSSRSPEAEGHTSLETKVLEHIHNNLVIILNITNLHNYYQWISLYPNLEKVCSMRFLNESTKPKELIGKTQKLMAVDDDQKVVDTGNFIVDYVRDFLTKHSAKAFEEDEHKLETIIDANEKVSFFIKEEQLNRSKSNFILSRGTASTKASADTPQIFKNPDCLNTYPHVSGISAEFFSEKRFKNFIDTFQKLYDMIKANLLKSKNFNNRYKDHCQNKIIETYHKKNLVKDSYTCSSQTRQQLANVASLNERIEELHAKIKEKEAMIKLKEKVLLDSMETKKLVRDEIDATTEERMEKLNQLLLALENCSRQEMLLVPSTYDRLSEAEKQLLEVLLYIVFLNDIPDKKFNSFVTKTLTMISDKQQLVSILRARRDTTFSESTIKKVKAFTQRYTSDRFDKSVFALIAKFLQGLAKKFNLKVVLEAKYEKLAEVNQILVQAELDISYYKNLIEDMKEELEDLLIKQRNTADDLKRSSRSISEEDARNEQVYKEVVKNLKKVEGKLFKSKVRMKNLFGDCLMLALSINYLGTITQEERTILRKELAQTLSTEKNIEVSEYWHSDNENDNSKIFKKLLCDFGYSEIFHSLSHLFNEWVFSEFFFTLMFAPSTPLVFDSVGYCHDYLKNDLFIESPVPVFASEYLSEEKLLMGMENKTRPFFIFDLTDYLSPIYGRIIDRPIFQRLTQDQVKLHVNAITNSKVPLNLTNVFTSQLEFCYNSAYKANCTVINANQLNKNEAWIEIKEVLLKHFLPDNYSKLVLIRSQLIKLKQVITNLERSYDDIITGLELTEETDEATVYEYLNILRGITERLKWAHEEYHSYNTAFHGIVNEHPLLASYSNIFVILYASLKELTKITGEITYSWKIFIKLIDMIIAKIIRDLTMNLKNKEESSEDDDDEEEDRGRLTPSGNRRKKKKKEKQNDREFTIDEEFFHSVIMPSIYSTIVAGIRQENISLFNLVFSLEIALKKTTVNREDIDFFLSQFFKIPQHKDWRDTNKTFIDNSEKVSREKYNRYKTLVLKHYPDTRKVFEIIDIQLGSSFYYKDLSSLVYKRILKEELKDEPLIKKINCAMICPNEEFKALLCQFVHEELTTIFDFTEDLTKLHNFIKTASWSLPVALFTSNSINIVNTVCSIASYYGVGLEVLRTDFQQSIKRMENYEESKKVDNNILRNPVPFTRDKLTKDAAGCNKEELLAGKPETDRMMFQKQQLMDGYAKDELDIDDKQASQNQSSLQLIEKCAENGTWVLISTLKFPSFWYKASTMLAEMQEKGKVMNTFRLFFDLQGYSLKEIPENFLFDH